MTDAGKKLRIVAVDDEPVNLQLFERALKGRCDLRTFTDGHAALDAMAQSRCDVLLTDVRMPLMDGIELARASRKKDASLVVVVVSAYPDTQTVLDAHAEGVVDLIVTKPWRPEQLDNALRVATSIRSMRD
jgi:two-component system, response regulator YesN